MWLDQLGCYGLSYSLFNCVLFTTLGISVDSVTSVDYDLYVPAQTHPGLFAALEHDASNVTKERMRNTTPMHIEAIKLWLDSIKMVTFS